MPIFKRRIFTRKVIYRLFQLNVGTFQKYKNAHACALRDCLGISQPFVLDTSPKCIDWAWKDTVQGLGNSHPMTTVLQTCDYYTTVYNRAEDEACYLVSQSKMF